MDAHVAAEAERQGGAGEELYWSYLRSLDQIEKRRSELASFEPEFQRARQNAEAAYRRFADLKEKRRKAGLGIKDEQGRQDEWLEREAEANSAAETEAAARKVYERIQNPSKSGDFGEYAARQKILSAGAASNPRGIQNKSGHGLDLVADLPDKGGKKQYLFAEVKEEGGRLSADQQNPETYIRSRLERSSSPEAKRILVELESGRAEVGRMLLFKVTDISKTTGNYKMQVLDWATGVKVEL